MKYYFGSFLVNTIPVIITYIMLSNCQGDSCMGKYLIWLTFPFWALIYGIYLFLDYPYVDKHSLLRKLIIFFPSIVATIIILLIGISEQITIQHFFKAFTIFTLPGSAYNIFINRQYNKYLDTMTH